VPSYTCNRCGHTWRGRLNRPPAECPKCRSRLWCVPKRKKGDYRRCGIHNRIKSMARRLRAIPNDITEVNA